MPRLRKGQRAAKDRELLKKLARNARAIALGLTVKPEPKYVPELPVEGESSPLEPTIEVVVKQEPVYTGTEDQFLQQDEVEVKEELLDPETSAQAEGEDDPIGGQGECRPLLQSTLENEPEDRCQFCFKLFQESGGRGIITKMKIEYVLGLTNWDVPGKRPNCCEECRKMFDMFYEFKHSCLLALARPVELFVWAGNKGPADFIGLKSTRRIKKTTLAQTGQIGKKQAQKSQGVAVFRGLVVKPKQGSLESKVVNTGAPSSEFEQTVKEAECAVCHEKVPNGFALSQHMLKHYPNESVATDEPVQKEEKPREEKKKSYCGRCRKYFADKEVYLQHTPECIEAHKRSKPPPPEFACSLCPKKFSREQDLGYHINKHNGVRTIPCRREGCTKMFCHPHVRKSHEKRCGQEAAAICSICGSIFKSKGSLRIHMANHEAPKFPCEICNKGFYTKANLKKHASVHSDERKFQCKVCGKRFKSHEANRVHQRIHTQEKPYICHICGQRFTYNCLLKTHLEKGHDTMPELPDMRGETFPPNPFGGFGF